jgi:uncharacterized protein
MANSKIFYTAVVLSIFSFSVISQELPRSAFFGALLGDINDSIKTALSLPDENGTVIKKVVANSSAESAGIAENDVIVAVNKLNIKNSSEFVSTIRKYYGGDSIAVSFIRESKHYNKNIILKPREKETSKYYEVIYSSVKSGENHLRTIITKPHSKTNCAAVLLIGGVGCYSVDNITNQSLLSTKYWVDSLTAKGFATLRVEKTGIGDSKGVPCNECDFHTETEGFLQGLKQLKSLPFVDKSNIFIAGFSMGGVIAPLIAEKEPVKGIIVYGTIGRNWIEYELENTHRQKILEGMSPDSLDVWMRAEYKRLYGLFVDKKSEKNIIEQYPETKNVFFKYPMNVKYFQQVADVNVRTLWNNTTASVLAMHGSTDFVSSKDEHILIANIVNSNQPGKAVYIEIPNADHWEMFTLSDYESKQHTSTEINFSALSSAISWLQKQVNKTN